MMTMNIKEVEKRTGISKQNIRYYEKQGLLSPERNDENDYRIYREEDVRRLLCVKMFRKLGMPIEQIRSIFNDGENLQDALADQKKKLQQEKKELEEAIVFCDIIQEKDLSQITPEIYLKKMEEKERQGGMFFDFVQDYKKVAKAEKIQSFSFLPDNPVETKEDFTKELFAYAGKHNLNLVLTKEGMYPEFTIDGVEYSAHRKHGRYGPVICCEAKYTEDYIPDGMTEKRYRLIHELRLLMIPVAIFFFVFLRYGINTGDYLFAFLFGIAEFSVFAANYMVYKGIE